MLAKSTSRDSWKIAFVPLPWCTSQSTISTRSAPERVDRVARGDGHVREQAEAHRARGLGVVAGRAQRGEAHALAAAEERLGQRAGAAGGVQRRVPGAGAERGVEIERRRRARSARAPPPRARAGAPRSSCSISAAGRLAPLVAQPVALRQGALDGLDALGRSGWPNPVSCSSDEGWRKRTGTRAGTVPTLRGGLARNAPAGRRRRGRRRRRRPVRGPRGRGRRAPRWRS